MSLSSPESDYDHAIRGVFPGPFGSLVHARGIDNRNPHALFSEQGQAALHQVFLEQAGVTTVGSTPTFRITNLRAGDGKNGQWDPHETPDFDPAMHEFNGIATRIARHAHGPGKKLVGLLAPLSDTSGGDDAKWRSLGIHQRDWVRRRQTPQIEALCEAGVDSFLVEAGRYVPEAEVIAQIVAATGGKALAFSFEAPDAKVPDPDAGSLRFDQVRGKMYDASRGRIRTQVGMNCVGVTAVTRAIEGGESLDVVYPNALDFGREGTAKARATFLRLVEKNRNLHEEKAFAEAQRALTTAPEEFEALWKLCLEARVQAISVCCGGTSEDVRRAWDIHATHSGGPR